MLPKTTAIFPIFDKSVTSSGIIKNLLKSKKSIEAIKIFPPLISNSWSEWKKYILAHQIENSAFIIGTSYSIRDNSGKIVDSSKVNKWIISNSNVPEMGLLTSQVKGGLLVTISNPGLVHGYEATHLMAQIINGTPIYQLPVTSTQQKALHINLKRAKQLNIHIPLKLIVLSRYYDEIGY